MRRLVPLLMLIGSTSYVGAMLYEQPEYRSPITLAIVLAAVAAAVGVAVGLIVYAIARRRNRTVKK